MNGHKVLVNITNYGDERKNPEGEVIKVLGHINDPGVDVLSVVYGYGIPLDFPEEVYLQAGRIPEEVSEKEGLICEGLPPSQLTARMRRILTMQ